MKNHVILTQREMDWGVIKIEGWYPKKSQVIHQILQEFHDFSHLGVLRMYKRLSKLFYWPSMSWVVYEYVYSCDVCQLVKFETLAPIKLLQPLPIPCQV